MRDDVVPYGVKVLQKTCPGPRPNRELCYRISVLVLTYIAYMCYHLTRKPISVVKNVLHQNCTSLTPPSDVDPDSISTWCDWAPFDKDDAAALLGTLDSAFLFAYAVAMFASGFVAERVNLRYFLAFGMLFSGIFSYLFGIAKSYNIHNLSYFIFVQVAAGIFQTTGWPGVVSVVGNWFGKGKRGLIFGVWNSHTSIGNILGSLIAAVYVETDWSLSFILPGVIMSVCGFVIFLFLVVHPSHVSCTSPDAKPTGSGYRHLHNAVAEQDSVDDTDSDVDDTEIIIGEHEVQRRLVGERTPILHERRDSKTPKRAIGFLGACRIPGVLEFSLSLFFAKLVSYTFLYWLPLYIKSSTTLSSRLSADLSTIFDVGGIVGAIAAGVISDQTNKPATTCAVMSIAAVPLMFLYEKIGGTSLTVNIVLLLSIGALVNGPYALITTAVSAELGTHSSLGGDSKALATVTAIIDGTGSIGAAVGPLLAGLVSGHGWQYVFYMLMTSSVLALVFLMRLVKQEICRPIKRFLAGYRVHTV